LFLRQSFHEYAKKSVLHSRWAAAYYLQQRTKGGRTTRPCGRWPSSGSGSSGVAGRITSPMTSGFTKRRYDEVKAHWWLCSVPSNWAKALSKPAKEIPANHLSDALRGEVSGAGPLTPEL
jgi:hypothetical protein